MIPFAQGIGFAIPINVAKQAAQDLVKFGRVVRPWMGISGVTITDEIAEYYSLPRRGVLVMRVGSYSLPAMLASFVGDVIVGIEDDRISKMDDLQKP